MFKESEKGKTEINIERAQEIKENTSKIVATGCPFCNTMLTDGTKSFEDNKKVEVKLISITFFHSSMFILIAKLRRI